MAVSVPTRKYIEARFVNIKSRIVNIELSVTKYIYKRNMQKILPIKIMDIDMVVDDLNSITNSGK